MPYLTRPAVTTQTASDKYGFLNHGRGVDSQCQPLERDSELDDWWLMALSAKAGYIVP